MAKARAPAFQLPGHSNVKAQPTNPETQTRKYVCAYQEVFKANFADRDATLEETEEEEAEREWAKQQRVSVGSGKGYTVSVECNARQKKGPPDCMKKPEVNENLREHGL